MLKFCEEDDMSDVPSSYVCDLCSRALVIGEKGVSILQELPEKVEDISYDDSLNPMYMASYVPLSTRAFVEIKKILMKISQHF